MQKMYGEMNGKYGSFGRKNGPDAWGKSADSFLAIHSIVRLITEHSGNVLIVLVCCYKAWGRKREG